MSSEVSAGEWAHPHIGRQAQPAHVATSEGAGAAIEDERELSFWDFLDLVNPLQHIPVVSTLYREITGDEISAPMRTLGGFLFAGPVGLVNGVVNGIVEEASDRDLGENFFALFEGDAEEALDPPVAAIPPAPATSQAALAVTATPTITTPSSSEATTADLPSARPEPKSDNPTTTVSLSGKAAVQAFLSDLGAASAGMHQDGPAGTTASVPAAPAAPSRFYALPARDPKPAAPVGSAAPSDSAPEPTVAAPKVRQISPEEPSVPAAIATANEPSVADRMLEALKKYETMAERRRTAGQGG